MTKNFQKLKLSLTVSVLIFCFQNHGYAQQNTAQYYNDGGLSDQKNMISMDLFSLYKPVFPISYDRFLSENFSITTEIAYLIPDYSYHFYPDDMYNPISHKYTTGPIPFRFMAGIKGWTDRSPNGFFVGLYYRYWRFEDARFHDALLGPGYAKLIGNHFVLKGSVNLGLRMIKYFDVPYTPTVVGYDGDLYYDNTHEVTPFLRAEFSVGYFF